MNEEVLKILNEPDLDYESDVDLTGIDINEILEEEEVEFEYLFPEEYEKNLRSMRKRRSSTYSNQAKYMSEDEINYSYGEPMKKQGISSHSKTIDLNYDDYKDVNYLQDILKDHRIHDLKVSIQNYTFDETKYPLMHIGNEPYNDYNPPNVPFDKETMARFAPYYELFTLSNQQDSILPKYTIKSLLEYQEQAKPQTTTESTNGSSIVVNVVNGRRKSSISSTFDSERADATIKVDASSSSYLTNNAKIFKTEKTGLPNAICVTKSYIIIGMSKSQILFFPNSYSKTELSPIDELDSPSQPSGSRKPQIFGSHENANENGSILSLATDLNETFLIAGYSTGCIEMINIEKLSSTRVVTDAHKCAIVFVRVLSNDSVLSVDYAGNMNITVFSKSLFGTSANSTRIIDQQHYGQIVDISIIPFSVSIRGVSRTSSSSSLTSRASFSDIQSISVDLVAFSTLDKTVIMTIDNNQANVLFVLNRREIEVNNQNAHYDEKSTYVQNCISSAWYRSNNNSFLFARCDDDSIEVWTISTELDSTNHLKYSILPHSAYRVNDIILSCSFLSPDHIYCILNSNQACIIDLQNEQLVRTINCPSKCKFVYGNVNKRIQVLMNEEATEEEKQASSEICVNSKVFANCNILWQNQLYTVCYDRIIVSKECTAEARFTQFCDKDDISNALLVGSHYVEELGHQLELSENNQVNDMEGTLRIKYYSYINRISALVVKLMEDNTIPIELRVGSSFDVLTHIHRSDLLFSSLLSLCEHDDNRKKLFFVCLTDYIKAGLITTILPSVLNEFLDDIEQNESNDERFKIEQFLMHLQYTADVDEIISILIKHQYLLAGTYFCVNNKGDFVQPIKFTHEAYISDNNKDYFSLYPSTINEPPSGETSLFSFLLFLIHSSIFGVNLTGISINSIGRVTNQNECFMYLIEDETENQIPLFHTLLLHYPYFILELILYALSVKMMISNNEESPRELDEDDEDDMIKMKVKLETENYKKLFSNLNRTIAKGFIYSIQKNDLPENIQLIVYHIFLIILTEFTIKDIPGEIIVNTFQFVSDHTEIINRDQLLIIINNYKFSSDVVDTIIATLLKHHLVKECIALLYHNHYYSRILQLYFSDIRTTKDQDLIHTIMSAIEEVIAYSIKVQQKEINGNMNELAASLELYYIPLLYLKSSIFAYYILLLENCDFDKILSIIGSDEKATFLFLQQFLLPHETPSLHLAPAIISPLLVKCQQRITDSLLLHFAELLIKIDKSGFLSFLMNNDISAETAKAMIALFGDEQSNEFEKVGPLCYLQFLAGNVDYCIMAITEQFSQMSGIFVQELKSIFNIKDLEAPFFSIRSLSQILTIFIQIFPLLHSEEEEETINEELSTLIDSTWREIIIQLTAIISATRKSLNLKVEMGGNRKVIAGLELLERTLATQLQRLLECLQIAIPLPALLSFVLSQNAGNTIRDISGIINKVMVSLQMDLKGFDNFVHIYRGDFNECLHQKVEKFKHPIVVKTKVCQKCGNLIGDDEEFCAYKCGHVYHMYCNDNDKCEICEALKNGIEKKPVSKEMLPIEVVKKEKEENEELSLNERLANYKAMRREVKDGSLYAIYNNMNGNKQQFKKLLEPPALFSSMPPIPDIAPEDLISTPIPGSLPVKPISKGECVLLMNVSDM